ncbi:hypothetical protein ACQ4PT_014723 [Festuca glaucescens]
MCGRGWRPVIAEIAQGASWGPPDLEGALGGNPQTRRKELELGGDGSSVASVITQEAADISEFFCTYYFMEKKQEIAASAGEKAPEQHAIDVVPYEHGDAKGTVVDAGADVKKERLAVVEEPQKKKSTRVAALDAFRGLTIVVMILVDDAGGVYERIDHSPWDGCTLADFVMPFFLFIVGVAIAFAMKRVPKKREAVKKVSVRTLKMLFWGILLQGGYSHAPDDLAYGVDMKRIALVYFVVALIEVFTIKVRPNTVQSGPYAIFNAYRWQWLGGFIVLVIYMVTVYSAYVPDWSYVYHLEGDIDDGKLFTVQCGVRGHVDPACNAVGYVDRMVWGINHLYTQPVWIRTKIDVWGLKIPFLFLEWIGKNAMLVFVLGAQGILAGFVNGWYYGSEDNNLVNWIQQHVFINVWHSVRLGSLLYVIFGEILFWGVVSGILHKLGIYWKL